MASHTQGRLERELSEVFSWIEWHSQNDLRMKLSSSFEWMLQSYQLCNPPSCMESLIAFQTAGHQEELLFVLVEALESSSRNTRRMALQALLHVSIGKLEAILEVR